MPDISMCADTACPSRARCHRNKASGTRPNDRRQSYMDFQREPDADRCANFCPAFREQDSARETPR